MSRQIVCSFLIRPQQNCSDPFRGQSMPLSTGHVVPSAGATSRGSNSTGTICKFESGPQAGSSHDYAPLPALPVGSPCQDGETPLSTGHVVSTSGATNGTIGPMSTICKFESGPQAGKTRDYAPLPPLPVGSSCEDGATPLSAGHVVKPN
jgi:hypothetical protein